MKVEGICFRCDVPLSLSKPGLLRTKGTKTPCPLRPDQNIETSRGYNFSEMNNQVRKVRYILEHFRMLLNLSSYLNRSDHRGQKR